MACARVLMACYVIRFTPREPRSNWSAVNVKRARELTRLGLMHPAGLQAFQDRTTQSGIYSHEQRHTAVLNAAYTRQFRANKKAWAFFQGQAAGYRKTAIWWVITAKREETKFKRLTTLIEDSAHGRTIRPLTCRRPW
jgi:uncharacterized protein YdeI (YjbR/CyaY-like superfamily)